MSTGWTIAIVAVAGVAGFYIGRRWGKKLTMLGRSAAAGAHSIAPVIDPKVAAAAKLTSAVAGTGQKV
jgi:UPF0716 family protein affecting phage T7 exclusion